jgi:hypothetical protein
MSDPLMEAERASSGEIASTFGAACGLVGVLLGRQRRVVFARARTRACNAE